MIKKIGILCVLLAVSFSAFGDAGLEIGPSVMLKFPFAVSDTLSVFSGLGIEDFKLGVDLEFTLGFFQIGALLDFKPGLEEGLVSLPPAIEIFATGSLLLDLKILRLGIGAGLIFVIDLPPPAGAAPPPPAPEGTVGLGIGIKANADVVLGPVVLRLNVISSLDVLRMAVAEKALEFVDFKVGLSLLIKL